ncbi:MAG: TAXI family TRAP transporter solute-binding subunit [Stellaceae bacterium]
MPARFGVWWCGPGVAAMFALALLWELASSGAQETRFFRIGAAATSGTFFEIGGVIAGAISKPAGLPSCEHSGNCGVPGLVAVAQATEGSVENLRMIAAGQIESGIAQSDIAGWAYTGAGIFAAEGPMKELRAIANLFPENAQIVVRGDGPIRTLTDLKGKRISLGQKGSGTLADARVILAAAGVTEDEISAEYLRPGVAATRMKEGTLDGFFLIGGVPVPVIRELAAAIPIRLVPIDDIVLAKIRESSSSYRRSMVPAATYRGIDEDTPSIGFNALWIVSSGQSDDLIYAITKALWNDASQRLFEAHNPIGKQVRLADALQGLTVPLHPGARRFYREAGLPVEDEGSVSKRK